MIVCHCKGITDRDIRRALRDGAMSRGEAHPAEAGSACGGCRPLVEEIAGKIGTEQAQSVRENAKRRS